MEKIGKVGFVLYDEKRNSYEFVTVVGKTLITRTLFMKSDNLLEQRREFDTHERALLGYLKLADRRPNAREMQIENLENKFESISSLVSHTQQV